MGDIGNSLLHQEDALFFLLVIGEAVVDTVAETDAQAALNAEQACERLQDIVDRKKGEEGLVETEEEVVLRTFDGMIGIRFQVDGGDRIVFKKVDGRIVAVFWRVGHDSKAAAIQRICIGKGMDDFACGKKREVDVCNFCKGIRHRGIVEMLLEQICGLLFREDIGVDDCVLFVFYNFLPPAVCFLTFSMIPLYPKYALPTENDREPAKEKTVSLLEPA